VLRKIAESIAHFVLNELSEVARCNSSYNVSKDGHRYKAGQLLLY